MKTSNDNVAFWQGNQACAEAAISAGCRFFAGYPITPASEIAEIMSSRLPENDGIYLQMEDEIAALSAVIGASWGGKLAMTATSGPGFSLMQEGIGYAIMTETPCVIVDVQRAGPSTGQATKAAQGDLMQSRWGTHGDHESIVLAPNSAQETYELTMEAFRISEMLRHPVIVLTDEIVAHSRERVVIGEGIKQVKRRFAKDVKPSYGQMDEEGHALMPRFGDGLDLLVTGSTHDENGFRKTSDSGTHDRLVRRLKEKVAVAQGFPEPKYVGPNDADLAIISFGSTSRSAEQAITESNSDLRTKGMQLRTLWPFPEKAVIEFSKGVEKLLVPELSLGQLVREVERVVDDSLEVVSLTKIGGGRLIDPSEIRESLL